MMEKTYKSFNKYNYTCLELSVNYANHTAILYKGGTGPLGYDVKTTSKKIREMVADLAAAGFKISEE